MTLFRAVTVFVLLGACLTASALRAQDTPRSAPVLTETRTLIAEGRAAEAKTDRRLKTTELPGTHHG